MTKWIPLAVATVASLTLALTGCAGPITPRSEVTPTPTSTHVSPTSAPEPAELVLSLDKISLVGDAGTAIAVAPFSDAKATLALVSDALGSTPVPEVNPDHGVTSYDWGDILLSIRDTGSAWVSFTSDEAAGLALTTVEGVHVGSTRAEVSALSPYEDSYDWDVDGVSDLFGLQSREVPGKESLSRPGEEGLDFVGVEMTGDVVSRIMSPNNNWEER
ncbi:MAG TPA: hypothetical protein VNT53_08030 [Pseudolysinimonas sp.]|nr:hypothetical protein [Pseudolysinimonas sp.]